MDCLEEGCEGKVNLDGGIAVALPVGCVGCCSPRPPAYPCNVCGRLYSPDGFLVFERKNNRPVFFINGQVLVKDLETDEMIEGI